MEYVVRYELTTVVMALTTLRLVWNKVINTEYLARVKILGNCATVVKIMELVHWEDVQFIYC